MKRALRTLGGLLLAIAAGSALAQTPPDPRFEIKTFRVVGSQLLPEPAVQAVLAPFTGPDRTLADIQKAQAALEAAYAQKGFGAVQVLLPEQEVARGEVVLRAVEAKLGKITIEGNRFFDEANIRASLPALQPGQSPNTQALANNLRVANENPAKQTTVTLRSGAEEGEVDAVVRVADQSPHKFIVSVDNTGTPQTGEWRVGAGYQYANLWNRDHVVNLQYVTSPTQEDNPNKLALPPNQNVEIFGGSYHIPLYSWGDSIDLLAGYANVNSGVVQNIYSISGAGRVYAGRYNLNLPRWAEVEQKIVFGADVRYYDNNVVAVGDTSFTRLVPDYVVHPLSAVYNANYRGAESEASLYIGASKNIPGGANGGQETFNQVRPGAPDNYSLFRGGVNYLRSLPVDLQFRFNMSGQYTKDELVPGEQYGIGGQDSVRGFYEREFANDKGFRGTVEMYGPDFGARVPISNLRARLLAFYDWGYLKRINPKPFDIDKTEISSVGMGLRFFQSTRFSLRGDYAWVVQGSGTTPSGSWHGHLSVLYAF